MWNSVVVNLTANFFEVFAQNFSKLVTLGKDENTFFMTFNTASAYFHFGSYYTSIVVTIFLLAGLEYNSINQGYTLSLTVHVASHLTRSIRMKVNPFYQHWQFRFKIYHIFGEYSRRLNVSKVFFLPILPSEGPLFWNFCEVKIWKTKIHSKSRNSLDSWLTLRVFLLNFNLIITKTHALHINEVWLIIVSCDWWVTYSLFPIIQIIVDGDPKSLFVFSLEVRGKLLKYTMSLMT